MRLLTGPPGSGKTAFVLSSLREHVLACDPAVRLLVPTATMAQHLQNQLAREGLVFRARLIQTLHAFVNEWAGDAPQASDPVVYLIVEEAVRQAARPEFARVAQLPGFCASLARAIEDFSSAGCDSARLSAALAGPEGAAPLGPAFLAVYALAERALENRGLALRARRLERAAARIAAEGLGAIHTIWLDGFHALPDPELRLIAALGRHADLTLTFESPEPRLPALGFEEQSLGLGRPRPGRTVVRAPGIEREAEEIGRRILEQAAAGRPFREIGIVVRTPEIYVPLLRATLERFGIPARFYFDQNLEEHAAARFLTGAVDALLSGWDHAQTMAVLRLAPPLADSDALDRMDFEVRRQIPNSGLGALKALAGGVDATGGGAPSGHPRPPAEGRTGTAEKLLRLIDALAALEEWLALALEPKDWAARLRELRHLFRPALWGLGQDQPHHLALQWRSQAAVLKLFDEALDEAAAALSGGHAMPLAPFWRAVKSVLRLKPLRLADGRRNVVHVIGAHEARQWVLPVLFVCGMVEKGFPQFHQPDPFFPEDARRRLNAASIRVRTAADFEREERALFESAISRATLQVVVSYPEFDGRGDRYLRSLYLDDWAEPEQPSQAARPAPRHLLPSAAPAPIRSAPLLEFLRRRSARLSPSKLESYLQCPFQYFAGRTLHLRPPPPRPQDRLDFLTQGTIVHEVLAECYREPQEIEPLFDRTFARYSEERSIPLSFQTERTRNDMLDHLRAFVENDEWPRAEFRSRLEEKFEMPVGDWVLAGKIDRLDEAADGRAYVIDYKYSRAENTRKRLKDENLLQAPLYLMAARRCFHVEPAGMFYIGLKGGIEYAGWSEPPLMDSDPLPPDWIAETERRAIAIVGEIRSGRVEVLPANRDHCRFCDAQDICRIEVGQAVRLPSSARSSPAGSAQAGAGGIPLGPPATPLSHSGPEGA